MGRCLGISGIFAGLGIIGLAVVFLIVFLTDNDMSNDLIADNLCNENETLVREETQVQTSDGNGTSITFYCNDNTTGEEREITGTAVGVAIGGFVLPLCCGILIIFGGSSLLTANVAKQAMNQFATAPGQSFTVQSPMPAQVTFTQESYTAAEVETRLQKLQEMLNNGTLSQEQYFQIEQELRSRQQF